jgi:hypothetical protein
MKALGISIILAAAIFMVAVFGYASVRPATAGNEDNIGICHRTNSVTNPYVQETVAPSSVDGDTTNDNGHGDHTTHTGPVFDVNAVYPPPHNGDQWGDIIPPNGNFVGLNWNDAGIAIYDNGCKVTFPATDTPVPAATDTPAGCEEDCVTPTFTSTPPQDCVEECVTPTAVLTATPTTPGRNKTATPVDVPATPTVTADAALSPPLVVTPVVTPAFARQPVVTDFPNTGDGSSSDNVVGFTVSLSAKELAGVLALGFAFFVVAGIGFLILFDRATLPK